MTASVSEAIGKIPSSVRRFLRKELKELPTRRIFSLEALAVKYGRPLPVSLVGLPDNLMRWVPESCPACGFPKQAIVALRGEPEITEKVCMFCGVSCGGMCLSCNLECEARQAFVSDNMNQDYIAKAGGYGTVHNLVFGRNQGTIGGPQRAKQLGDAIRKSNPELKQGDVRFMEPYRELQNQVSICPEGPIVQSVLEMISARIKIVQHARSIVIPENRADNIAKMARKRIREARIKPTSKKARRLLAEDVLARESFWPP